MSYFINLVENCWKKIAVQKQIYGDNINKTV